LFGFISFDFERTYDGMPCALNWRSVVLFYSPSYSWPGFN